MNNTKLIFYEHKELYEIFNEIKNNFDYELFYIKNQSELTNTVEKLNNYLIICKNIIPNEKNQISFENFPLSITTIINKINVEILKNNYSEKSKIEINRYRIDLNSKEMSLTGTKLKFKVPFLIHLIKSASDGSLPSKYASIIFSSSSTAVSTRFCLYSLALSFRSSGIST